MRPRTTPATQSSVNLYYRPRADDVADGQHSLSNNSDATRFQTQRQLLRASLGAPSEVYRPANSEAQSIHSQFQTWWSANENRLGEFRSTSNGLRPAHGHVMRAQIKPQTFDWAYSEVRAAQLTDEDMRYANPSIILPLYIRTRIASFQPVHSL